MLIGSLILVLLIAIDFCTKLLASTLIPLGETRVIIPGVLEFSHITNPGASIGSFQDQQALFMLVTIVSLIIFGYLFSTSNYKTKKIYSLSSALFIAGTFGNAIDRVFRNGHVIDFIHIPFLGKIADVLSFTFNMADLFLNLAIVLFAIDIFFLEKKHKDKENAHEISHT